MAQRDPAENSTKPHWTVASVALFVIGLLILVPSGLCSAWALTYAIDALVAAGDLSLLAMVLVFGGLPLALGIALIFWSLRIRRQK